MSDQHSSMQPVRPLTRREIREREAAAAEQSAGGAGQPAPAGGYAPPVPPPAPAPVVPQPSRRAMRDVSAPTPADAYSSPAPVVRPPSMTGGMRGVDETGRLTPIQETAERVAIRPAQPPSPGLNPPVRQSMRAPSTTASPFAASERPTTPEPAPRSAPSPFPPAQQASPFPSAQAVPARESVASRTPPPDAPRAAATPAPAPAPLPWEQGTAPGALARSQDRPRAALPWETQAPPAPAQPDDQPSPFPSAVSPASPGPGADSPFPPAAGARANLAGRGTHDDEDDEVDERPPGHAYTWLHYLILIAVAFVLGLLIWQLLLGKGASVAEMPAPAGIETLASNPSNHHGLSS